MRKIITTIFILLFFISCSGAENKQHTEESFIGAWKNSNTVYLGDLTLDINTIKEYEKDGTYIAESLLKFLDSNDALVAEYSMIGKAKWKISDNELIEYSKTIDSITKKSSNDPVIQQVLSGLKQMAEDGITVVSKIIHVDENRIVTRNREGEDFTIIRVR